VWLLFAWTGILCEIPPRVGACGSEVQMSEREPVSPLRPLDCGLGGFCLTVLCADCAWTALIVPASCHYDLGCALTFVRNHEVPGGEQMSKYRWTRIVDRPETYGKR